MLISWERKEGGKAHGLSESGAAAGFFRARSHDLIPVTSCLIQTEEAEPGDSLLRIASVKSPLPEGWRPVLSSYEDFWLDHFYSLGIGEPIPVSSANKLNFGDVLDQVCSSFPEGAGTEDDDRIRLAIIGKPNVGKSSLINALIQENRVIVSDIAGTTRDSIDTPFRWQGKEYVLIDTAGIRRQSRINEDIEKYSVIRAVAAIERSDVCILMIDAAEGLTEQDKKICGLAHEAGKGIVIVVNKWDLVKKETNTMRDFRREIQSDMQFASYAPILFISVKDHIRLSEVMQTADRVAEIRAVRVPTGQLNSLMTDAMMMKQPPSDKGRRLKIYYVAQVGVKPPLFSFQVNKRQLMHFSYARYLENRIRETFGFEGTSIKFVYREKREKDQ